MTQIACPCGHQMSDTTDRVAFKHWVIPDARLESIINAVVEAAGGPDPEGQMGYEVIRFALTAYEYTRCGRLLIFGGKGGNSAAVYRRE